MALLLNLGGLSLDLDAPSGSGSSSSSNWLYLGAYDNGVSYNTSDVVLYNGGLWYCYTSANLSAGYPPDSRPECWVQVSSTNFAGIDLTGISFNPSGSYGGSASFANGDFIILPDGTIQIGAVTGGWAGNPLINIDSGGFKVWYPGNSEVYSQLTATGLVVAGEAIDLINLVHQGDYIPYVAYQGDNVSEFNNDALYINAYGDSWGNMYPGNSVYLGGGPFGGSAKIVLSPDGSASFANGAATIDSFGILSIGNSVSSSSDNSVDSKVEIVINGTTYYLLASTSAS